jgi:integrase
MAMRGLNRLSAATVRSARKPRCDGGGLWLLADETGPKSWAFRFMREGVAREMGLGPIHTIGLADARQRAQECRRLLLDDVDPIEDRKRRRLETRLAAAKQMTFRECAEKYVAANKAAWRSAVHRRQWDASLATYAMPIIGDLPISAIDDGLVLKVIEPIWHDKPETASRLRNRIETVIDWATVRKYRQGLNPARWGGHIEHLLPSRTKLKAIKHFAALPYIELPGFMRELRAREGVDARALEFAILTAARSAEVIGARWCEISLSAKVWTIPAERMKAGREHRVPLSARAVELLRDLPRNGDYVFAGIKAGQPIALSSFGMLLHRKMKRAGVTAHGFRSCFADWASERTAYPPEVREMALAHAVGDKTEQAYRRTDLFAKRAKIMDDWARFAGTPTQGAANVVAMRAGAAS